MNLFYKRKVIQELTYSDGDFSVSWSEMKSHLHTPLNGCGVGYFDDFPYPKERDEIIDEYLIKKGVAIRNRDGDLEVTEKTSEFIERFNELLNNI
tara:strand:- start:157 stop:441 length:285 start_codon:yes stop_codon:yes gene_type:complete